MGKARIDCGLLSAFLRLYELCETPEKIRFIAPVLIKEIHLRLLLSPLGKYICAINTPDGSGIRLAEVMSHLRNNYKEISDISELSKIAGMSQSTFYRKFRAITGMSPLQYQKRLRLYEAKRLMIENGETAANAAYAVGYESPSQFSREYKKIFGAPPKKNIVQ